MILASNTSQFSISRLAAATSAAGPGDRLALVQPAAGDGPDRDRARRRDLGRDARDDASSSPSATASRRSSASKDTPGFITSRLIVALMLEAMRIVEEGIATAEDVDLACQMAFSHAMGPLDTVDFSGLDTSLQVADNLREHVRRALPRAAGRCARSSPPGTSAARPAAACTTTTTRGERARPRRPRGRRRGRDRRQPAGQRARRPRDRRARRRGRALAGDGRRARRRPHRDGGEGVPRGRGPRGVRGTARVGRGDRGARRRDTACARPLGGARCSRSSQRCRRMPWEAGSRSRSSATSWSPIRGARFGAPEVRLGLMPGAGATQRLPRRIGVGPARAMILLGTTIDAAEAQRLGLVHAVSEPGAALAEALALARGARRAPRGRRARDQARDRGRPGRRARPRAGALPRGLRRRPTRRRAWPRSASVARRASATPERLSRAAAARSFSRTVSPSATRIPRHRPVGLGVDRDLELHRLRSRPRSGRLHDGVALGDVDRPDAAGDRCTDLAQLVAPTAARRVDSRAVTNQAFV